MRWETERIRLRRMTAEDIPSYHRWRNDMEVMQTTNPYLELYTLAETEAFVHHVILGGGEASKNWMIADCGTDQAIGIMALTQIDYKNRNAGCIIDIGEKDFWGQGIAKEALALLLEYAFGEMNLHRVSLRVFSFNERAIRAYTKLGFQHEGVSRQAIFRHGDWHDVIHMGMLQEEFLSKGGRLNESDY